MLGSVRVPLGTSDFSSYLLRAMRAAPVNDFYNTNVRIDPDGCVLQTMYVWEVKPPSEIKHNWDYYKPVSKMDGAEAFPPESLFGCTLTGA